MMNSNQIIASLLLDIKAIKLSPEVPFQWASGWKSPIYCDNRITLSHPEVRNTIRDEFVMQIRERYPDAEVIAGVATGAIAHAVLVADKLNLPFIYVRPRAKTHGLGNQIEGAFQPGQKVVIIEDLVSTGKSSLHAYEVLHKAGLDTLGMLAIFTYEFPEAEKNFIHAGCPLTTLSNYHNLIDLAIRAGYLNENNRKLLESWRKDPATWPQT